MKKGVEKRKSLLIISLCLCALSLANGFFSPPPAKAADKALIQQSDFTYLGSFLMPASGVSGDPTFGKGLTHRYVNGELRMFSTSWSPQVVYEVKVPALTDPPQAAQVVRDWGNVTGNKQYTASGTSAINGLYWDETDKRLYWNYGDPYNMTGNDPSFGYSTLNDTTGTSTPVGAWRMPEGDKATDACVLSIPQWFASAYTGGKRLGAGCGSYRSIATSGPASMGPFLTAFSPPASTQADRSLLASLTLVGYPFVDTAGTPYSTPDRAHRDTNYSGDGDWVAWPPNNGIGYFTAGDAMLQAGVWIDLPDKSGLFYFPTLCTGHCRYGLPEAATIMGDGASHWWYGYNPSDLALVAQGGKQQWEIQATVKWQVQYPGLSYPLGGWRDLPPNMVTGVTYDSTTRRLYVAVEFAGPGGAYGVHRVCVYEVRAGSASDITVPAPPQKVRVR